MVRKAPIAKAGSRRIIAVSNLKAAIALHRTPSSLVPKRERDGIEAASHRAKCIIIAEFSYAGGADEELFESDVFKAVLKRLSQNNVGAIFVSSRTTFADDPLVQAIAARVFLKYDVEIICLAPDAPEKISLAPAAHVERIFAIAESLDRQLHQMEEEKRLRFRPPRRKCYAEMFPEAVV